MAMIRLNEISDGAELSRLVALAGGQRKEDAARLYANGGCLYRESGFGGGEPFDFRPDSRWDDSNVIIYEVLKAGGKVVLEPSGASLAIPGYGFIATSYLMQGYRIAVGTPFDLCRCYVAWKLGDEFDPDEVLARLKAEVANAPE